MNQAGKQNSKTNDNLLLWVLTFIPLWNSLVFIVMPKTKRRKFETLGIITFAIQGIMLILILRCYTFSSVLAKLFFVLHISTSDQTGLIALFAEIIIYFMVVITLIVKRKKYKKVIKAQENHKAVNQYIAVASASPKPIINENAAADVIDINSADQEAFASLQGLTIVDAKKAISYRDEHNGFNNIDEFFMCIGAKPHIIVSIKERLYVGDYKALNVVKEANGKRKIDF